MAFILRKIFSKHVAKALPASSAPANTDGTQYKSIEDCIRNGTDADLCAWIRKRRSSIHEKSTVSLGRRNIVEVHAIQLAAVLGMPAKMKMLHDAGADVDAPLPKGYTMPILAARSKNAETMAFALAHSKADMDAQHESGRTALIEACISGDASVVREILKHNPDITICPQYGAPALTAAAKGGHTEIVKTLLDAGADIDLPDRSGQTALWWALHWGKADTVDYLLQRNASTQTIDNRGCTILMKAAAAGHRSLVKTLLEGGANPNQRDHSGSTPLHYAVLGVVSPEKAEILDILINHEAHPGLKNSGGITPLALAEQLYKNHAVAFLQKLPTTAPKIKTDHFTAGTENKIQTLKTIRLRTTRKHSQP